MGDRTTATRFCQRPQEITTECANLGAGRPVCPPGFSFLRTTTEPCRAAFGFSSVASVCEKTEWDKPRWRCCMESDGSDAECEPGFCRANIDTGTCQDELDERCLTDVTQMLNPMCRAYVQREANRRRKKVISAVQKYCKSSDLGFNDPFCRCVNANDPDLCQDDNCWARRNLALRNLNYCAAEECTVPRDGVFQPIVDNCVDICAPVLEVQGANITASESTTLFSACGDEWSESEKARIRNLIASSGTENGAGASIPTLPDPPKSANEQKDSRYPTWVWAVVGIGAVLTLLLIVLIVRSVAQRRRAANEMSYYGAPVAASSAYYYA